MKISTTLSILTLAVSLTGASGQFFERIIDFFGGLGGNSTEGGLPISYVDLECTEESRTPESTCNLAPFGGQFVCRDFFSFLFLKSSHTICAREVVDGVTLGLSGDTCGCCDGECPIECPCKCGDGEDDPSAKVYVRPVIFGQRTGPDICVTNGQSKHLTAWGGRVECTPADECPTADEDVDADVDVTSETADANVITDATEAPTSV